MTRCIRRRQIKHTISLCTSRVVTFCQQWDERKLPTGGGTSWRKLSMNLLLCKGRFVPLNEIWFELQLQDIRVFWILGYTTYLQVGQKTWNAAVGKHEQKFLPVSTKQTILKMNAWKKRILAIVGAQSLLQQHNQSKNVDPSHRPVSFSSVFGLVPWVSISPLPAAYTWWTHGGALLSRLNQLTKSIGWVNYIMSPSRALYLIKDSIEGRVQELEEMEVRRKGRRTQVAVWVKSHTAFNLLLWISGSWVGRESPLYRYTLLLITMLKMTKGP
jgi:hypothetical protein